MKHFLLTLSLFGLLSTPALAKEPASTESDTFEVADDIHYERLTPAQSPVGESGKLEVVEFFSYGCGHCHNFEPVIHPWSKTLPKGTQFERVPVSFGNPSWMELVKLYYTLEIMDKIETHHAKVFNAIHEEKINLANPEARSVWLNRHSIDEKVFNDTFDSFAVDTKTRHASKLAMDYNIQSVPSMFVGGQYKTGSRLSGSNKNTLKVVDYLIKKELN